MSVFQQSEFDRLQTNFNTFQEDSDDDDEPPPPSYQQGNFNDYEASTTVELVQWVRERPK